MPIEHDEGTGGVVSGGPAGGKIDGDYPSGNGAKAEGGGLIGSAEMRRHIEVEFEDLPHALAAQSLLSLGVS